MEFVWFRGNHLKRGQGATTLDGLKGQRKFLTEEG